jgi:hypothetical protein
VTAGDLTGRLDRLRGATPYRPHTARTVAALTANPGCARRAVLDAAGVDKDSTARQLKRPAAFGQSRFALARSRAFVDQVKADGCAELVRLLRERLGLSIPEVGYEPLDALGEGAGPEARHAHTRRWLRAAAEGRAEGRTLFDRPLLRLPLAGHTVDLEPDLIAFQNAGAFHLVQIKSFAVIDGQADPGQVAAAAREAAVYLLALRELMAEFGVAHDRVSHEIVLVCPENFSNRPTVTFVDVRRQLGVVRRQLSRMTTIEALLDTLPPGLTFDLRPDEHGVPSRPADELGTAVQQVPARYAAGCLSSCEMAYFCRAEARACGSVDMLGASVRDALGGITTVGEALSIADGSADAEEDLGEIARILRHTARLHAAAGAM